MRIKKEDADHVRTWMDLNPEHRYELLTDGAAETYVKDRFTPGSRITNTYLGLGDYIMRADLIRYLALLEDGGVYNDVDVGCLKPIDIWIPPTFKDKTSVVLGIELDNDFGPNRSNLFQFVNWTLMARRNAPFMRFLVNRVISNVEKAAAKHRTTLSDLQPKRQEVIDVTGPAALTSAAFAYLTKETGTVVNMQNFTKMRKPKLVADILILPINAFGAGHQVQWSGTDEDGSALVHHYFAGSWKTDHFDGPTEEEKKTMEAKKEAEEEQKRKKEEARKKAEAEQKKKEDDKKKAEEEQKRKEEEQKKKSEEEAREQQAKSENQPDAQVQTHNQEGQRKEQDQATEPNPQIQDGGQKQPVEQNAQAQNENQHQGQENGQEQRTERNEEAEQKHEAPQSQQGQTGDKTEQSRQEQPVNAVLEQEKQKAIEALHMSTQ